MEQLDLLKAHIGAYIRQKTGTIVNAHERGGLAHTVYRALGGHGTFKPGNFGMKHAIHEEDGATAYREFHRILRDHGFTPGMETGDGDHDVHVTHYHHPLGMGATVHGVPAGPHAGARVEVRHYGPARLTLVTAKV